MSAAAESLRRLEATRRRRDAPHPDGLAAVHLHGVRFAVRPPGLAGDGGTPGASGERVGVRFDAGGRAECRLEAAAAPQVDGELAALADAIARRRRRGRLRLDGDEGLRLLGELATLAAAGLRRQYELSDAELAELLSFPTTPPPAWPGEVAALVLRACRSCT